MAKKTKNTNEMTPQEACKELGVSMPTLRRRVMAKKLTPVAKPVGLERHHRLIFDREEIERYIKANS